jgi:hypothetical protein
MPAKQSGSWRSHDLQWIGNTLCRKGQTTPVVTVVTDQTYPSMWRVQYPDGSLSDMVNRTRARDAALTIALAVLNGVVGGVAAPPRPQIQPRAPRQPPAHVLGFLQGDPQQPPDFAFEIDAAA